MISRYECTLDGIALTSLSPSIYISDINYYPPEYNQETFIPAKLQGARVVRSYKERASVTVTFQIRDYSTVMRQTICQAIVTWARDGKVLHTSDRPGQRLVCFCEQYPVITSAMRWTDDLSITFTALNVPYWQEDALSRLTISGTHETGLLTVPGNAPDTVVEVTVVPQANLSEITLKVKNTQLTLSNLGAVVGDRITITYDEQMIQSIKKNSTSILSKRTGADDLKAICGKSNEAEFTATAACSVTFYARGRWE